MAFCELLLTLVEFLPEETVRKISTEQKRGSNFEVSAVGGQSINIKCRIVRRTPLRANKVEIFKQ